ncbi:MAG: glucose 1-dehydrogenase [Polaromonas sp.]|nr:glucose 1-dehydrogenase [Polaromonas sp.]
MKSLGGRVAIVTGGASGIGAAVARRFINAGATVVLADVQDDRGRRLAEALGPSCHYRRADVSREAEVQQLIQGAHAEHGRLDCLVNNAGVAGPGGGIAQIQPESWDATMGVVLRSVYLGMHFAAPIMTAQGHGSIINMASVAGFRAGYGSHVYSAAKAAIMQLTVTVGMELGESGVRVNCVCPGAIATPMFGKAAGLGPEEADAAVAPLRSALARAQPIQRAGEADDVAEAVLWLAGDGAAFVNAHALVVDGGLTGGKPWSAVLETRSRMRAIFEQAAT